MKTTVSHLPLPSPEETASRIAFVWLLHLRWGAVGCQLLLILAIHLFFAISLPLGIIFLIIGFEISSNIVFCYLKSRITIPGWLITLVLFLDVSFLTALLAFSGGPMNPFTFLYLIHIVLGAILLRSGWSWALAGYTVLCYASFFLPPEILASIGELFGRSIQGLCHYDPFDDSHLLIHLKGMWIAFAVTAFFIIFFVGKIQKALVRHQEALARLQDEKIRSEKMASLATLSAGAAHELSTPLATIAVASGEMLHTLQRGLADPELMEDARLIRSQVEKCKEILAQMAADAGEPMGETEKIWPVRELLRQTMSLLPPEANGRIVLDSQADPLPIRIPPLSLRRALKGLLTNALDAAADGSPVHFQCRSDAERLYFEVNDQGKGMDRETLAKAMEPFFTSKETGKGMGLGLFLARSVAERLGGELHLSSEPGRGTTVVLSLPLARILVSDQVSAFSDQQ